MVGRDEAALDAEREAVGAPEPEEVGGDGRELPQHHLGPCGLAGVSSGLLILFSGGGLAHQWRRRAGESRRGLYDGGGGGVAGTRGRGARLVEEERARRIF